jgi:hypothetical protein
MKLLDREGSMVKFDKIEVSGLIVLFIGVFLLALTFFSAYIFLSGNLAILVSANLTQLFGNALAPLIEAVIRILYLGVMGWMGSILTIRSIQLLKREKEPVPSQQSVKAETKQSASAVARIATATTTRAREQKSAVKEPVEDPQKTESQETTQVLEPAKEFKKEAQEK